MIDLVKRIFDPIGITGGADTGKVSAAEAMVDYAKEARDRADRERARLAAQVELAVTALQAAVDRLTAAVTAHYDKVAEIDRLGMHVKDNILFYMQAVWDLEPPDQRFFRLYDVDAPDIRAETAGVPVTLRASEDVVDVLPGIESLAEAPITAQQNPAPQPLRARAAAHGLAGATILGTKCRAQRLPRLIAVPARQRTQLIQHRLLLGAASPQIPGRAGLRHRRALAHRQSHDRPWPDPRDAAPQTRRYADISS